MRHSIRQFVEIATESLTLPDPVYEFGAFQVAGQQGFADLRPLFPGKTYVGTDMRPGLGVDRVLNLHDLDLESETVATALCLDTLEHVEYPHRALEEIHRVLKPGGVTLISSIMRFPIHDYPHDYWRFTPEAFKSLLKPFAQVYVDWAGDELFPHTVIGVGIKAGETQSLDALQAKMLPWKERWTAGLHWMPIIRPWVPPILIDFYIRARTPKEDQS